ncbi:MAG: lysozyme inhibitor [Betaproteobacteria bacterium]|nr:lysozyme inhibitor [Betaproteobacteria bacterium]
MKLTPFFFMTLFATLLSACSTISLPNPFGSDNKERARAPKDATEYLCEGNKRFYLRMLNNGRDAWLIYPTHEVNLSKAAGNDNRYVSGAITLVISGNEVTLNDGEKIAYTGCKVPLNK